MLYILILSNKFDLKQTIRVLHNILNVIRLNVIIAECHYAERRYAECRGADLR